MQLLINADDFGISESVNLAIDYCFKCNIIQRTTLMVNMDGTDSAVELAKKHGYAAKVGLHLNLIEGIPLTEPIKKTIFCTDGVFDGQALLKHKNRFLLDRRTQKAVESELRAQMEKYVGYGFTLLHIDSHEHAHTNPSIFKLLLPLLKEFGFLSCRLSRNIPKSEIGGLKRIYKDIFNRKVLRTFSRTNDKEVVKYFGSQKDIEKIWGNSFYETAIIEVETHPIIENGTLKDAIHSAGIEKWISHFE